MVDESKIRNKIAKVQNLKKRAKLEEVLQKMLAEECDDASDVEHSPDSVGDLADVIQAVTKLLEHAEKVDDPDLQKGIQKKAFAILDGLECSCEPEPHPPVPPNPVATTALVARTGQSKCWDTSYKKVDYTVAGQDGAILAGVKWPEPRFDEHDGTVTDRLTGLIWLKDADAFDEVTWDQARAIAHNLDSGSAGLEDGSSKGQWRLPTIRELFSIVDYSRANPIVDCDVFANAKSSIYWSSTTLQADPSQAWMMTLGIGPTVFMIKSTPNRMWPVRDGKYTTIPPAPIPQTGQTQTFGIECVGQDGLDRKGVPWPTPRFHDNKNGTVTDNMTGLVWLRNGNAFGWQTWELALKKCHTLQNGCHGLNDGSKAGDWRLPNIREIESLVDYGSVGPSLPNDGEHGGGWQSVFQPDPASPIRSTIQPSSYWTSTTVAGAPSEAMFIILGVGPAIFDSKEQPFFVLPVRNQLKK